MKLKKVWIIIMMFIVSGCTAIGVPATRNPQHKLSMSMDLIYESDRPLPAERLLKESVDIYKKNNDAEGLAEAYRSYAYFLHSKTVGVWEKHYRRDGFLMDKSVTFDNRHQKAVEYFLRSKDLYEEIGRYDAVSNIYSTIGMMYYFTFKNNDEACRYYDLSLISHNKFKQDNPGETIELPEGVNSFEEYIDKLKKKCQ